MRRAKGWSVPLLSSGVASTANPRPLPSISSVLWQQASPSRFTPRAESLLGEGPCVVLSMISRSASPRRGDSGSMLHGGGVGSYLGSSDEGRAAQPSRARSVWWRRALAALLVDRWSAMGASATASSQGRGEERGKCGDTLRARPPRADGFGALSAAATALAARRRVVWPFCATRGGRTPRASGTPYN